MSKLLCVAILVSAALLESVLGDCSCEQKTMRNQTVVTVTCTDCDVFPLDQIPVNVQFLHLPDNRIKRIPALTNLTKLEFLDISSNQINTIDNAAFEKCQLVSLNMTSNRMGNLSSKMFEGTDKLIHLLLGANDLVSLNEPDLFREHTRSLEVLNLTSNHISHIEHNAITDLENLKLLDLSSNEIEWHHPLHFAGLKTLEYLYLNGNKLVNLSANVFADMDNIKMLDLSDNQIKEIENMAFQGLQHSLEILHLSRNKIEVIHEEFKQLIKLRDLFINDNPITEFKENVLPQSLQNFNMERCREIEILPNDTFVGLKNLRYVYIKQNSKLQVIEPEAFDMAGRIISVVDLSSNALEHLDFNTLLWQNISNLNLQDNNWDCDCTLSWMKMGLPEEAQRNVKCQTPYQLQGKSIRELQFDEFSCQFFVRYKRSLAITLILIVTVLFVMFVSFLVYRKRHRVLPCCFRSQKDYRTLYNTGDPDETAVTVERPTVDYVEEGDDALPPPKPKREYRDSTPRVAAV